MTVVPFRNEADVVRAIPQAVAHLEAGHVLGYPTETVYGLGSETHEGALKALGRLKGRDPGKPFLLVVADREMAEAQGLVFTPAAAALAEAFWPGPLTLVLRDRDGRLPSLVRGPGGGVAVRWTSHGHLARLIRGLGRPISSTSANRPGQATFASAQAVQAGFREAVSTGTLLVLDSGSIPHATPSTLVDCTTAEPRILREGVIPRTDVWQRLRASRS